MAIEKKTEKLCKSFLDVSNIKNSTVQVILLFIFVYDDTYNFNFFYFSSACKFDSLSVKHIEITRENV